MPVRRRPGTGRRKGTKQKEAAYEEETGKPDDTGGTVFPGSAGDPRNDSAWDGSRKWLCGNL